MGIDITQEIGQAAGVTVPVTAPAVMNSVYGKILPVNQQWNCGQQKNDTFPILIC